MRLTPKLLVLSLLLLLVVILALLIPVRIKMREQVIEDMQREIRAIAATAALQLDGDLHRQVRTAADAASPAFGALRAALLRVRAANPHLEDKHIYTFYRDGEQVRFAVMTHAEPFVGNPYTLQPLMRPVFERGDIQVTGLYTDEHGEWISAYAPIRDSAGQIAGILEVDRPSTEYFARYRYVTLLNVVLGLVVLGIASFLGWYVLGTLVIRPLSAVHEGMRALGRRDFKHRVKLSTNDEFEDLADTLNRLFEQLNVARMIQSGFFPRELPTNPGYRLAACSLPCDATGGDYFDAFSQHDGSLAVLVADVSGHGLGPSLLMSSCRSTVRALSTADLSTGQMIDRIDRLLESDLTDGRFITMVFGALDRDGEFSYTNAGHGPAMIVQAGALSHLEVHRPPLGVRLNGEDETLRSSVRLSPGDRVFLASDGLSEAMNAAGDFFGLERIEQIVADRGRTCEDVLDTLRDELIRHCGGQSTTDDVTMICVDRLA